MLMASLTSLINDQQKNKMKTAKEIYLAATEYAADATLSPVLLAAAMDACDVARDAWLASDDPRDWQVGGESWGDSWGDRMLEICPSDIGKKLRKNCKNGEWDNEQTIWVDDWARPIDPVTDEPVAGERVDVTTTIEVDEPDCEKSEHDWQSPEMLGGCEENPGVHGHGGGVIITEVCGHCGKYKSTDTWAQNPSTGEQGLTSVEYAEADDRSEQWLNEARAKNE